MSLPLAWFRVGGKWKISWLFSGYSGGGGAGHAGSGARKMFQRKTLRMLCIARTSRESGLHGVGCGF